MKKIQLYFVIVLAIVFNSCEEVIPLDLNTAPPKLVIEASINWVKGSAGNEQKIKLTTTTDYYSKTIPKISGATIFIKNSAKVIFNFIEKPKTGEYICSTFVPKINEVYELTVISEGQTYTATETLKSVPKVTQIAQNNQGGFTKNKIEIKAFFNDPANEDNYYLFRYIDSGKLVSDYFVNEDKFFNGNEFFSISQNNDLKAGDKLEISHFGISKAYFNYMNILINIAGTSNGRPFQSPPATVRGNIINTTNFDNYPLGYFSVSEVDVKKYIVQ